MEYCESISNNEDLEDQTMNEDDNSNNIIMTK